MTARGVENKGHAIGPVTKGATTYGTVAGAVAALVTYALVKSGFETDVEQAVLLGSVASTLVSALGTLLGGKFTPSEPLLVEVGVSLADPQGAPATVEPTEA